MTIALLAAGTTLGAQTIHGRTLSPLDSSAVGGVLVQVTDSSGRLVAQVLTDEHGFFSAHVPAATYRLRGLRIGWQPSTTALFDVPVGGTVERSLFLTGGVVVLTPSRVTAVARCADAADSSNVGFAAWEEARKALTASLLTRAEKSFALRWVRFERETRRSDGAIVAEGEWEGETTMLRPFSAVGAAQLSRRGYVEQDSSGTEYFAPDEEVLLSEQFAESHCIHAVSQPAEADSIVIGFEPTRDRTQPEVAGTLVIERKTAELRRLTFHYVHVPDGTMEAASGGEVHFRRLPGGRWLVDEWSLRLPVYERRRVRTLSSTAGTLSDVSTATGWHDVVSAIRTTGAEIYWISDGKDVVWRGNAVDLEGRVLDSLGVSQVAAVVSLRGTTAAARTDSSGAFRLVGVRPGRRLLTISPTYRDSLGIEPFSESVNVDSTPETGLLVLIPIRDSVASRICSGSGPGTPELPGILRGAVRDRFGGRLGENDVMISWTDAASNHHLREVVTRSSPTGDFRACNLPVETLLTLSVHRPNGETGESHVRIPTSSRAALVDVHVAPP